MKTQPTLLATLLAAALGAVMASASLPASAQSAQNADPLAWDLRPLYADDAAWTQAREALRAEIPKLAALKGSLGRSPAALRQALDRISAANLQLDRLGTYAYSLQSTDNRDRRNQERLGLVMSLYGEYGAALAWLDPEIQGLGAQKLAAFQKAEPGLAKHATRLRHVMRLKPHTLTAEAEAVAAALAPVRGATGQARTLLVDADIRWPSIKIDGKEEKIDDTSYGRWRQHPDRAVRKQVFDTFFSQLGQFENTFGTTLGASVQDNVVMARLRKHPSAVASTLAADEVPETVYRTLVAETRKGLPTLHRAFKLRQQMLQLPDLHYYDIYPALVKLGRKYPFEDAKQLAVAAAAPLGAPYQAELKRLLGERTMHVLPAEGKSGGAYQTGVYGLSPLVFLNHQDNYESVSTLVHEWGHGMHTLLANQTQPYESSNYPLFLAEIAAITNEVLLSKHMLGKATSKEERLYLLGQELERLRGTYYRQTMFAEFELRTHDAVQAGEAMSGKRMTEIYCGLLKDYHGDAQGVMKIDPQYCQEWAFIPHFYRAFYVYQYATSMAAAQFFADRIASGDTQTRDTYLNVLRGGGSRPPVEALKAAGLDMNSPAPYQAVIRRMDAIVDEMEKLLAAK
ncbi:MAG: oligoendopeptidase F [Burkholderiales bacterium]|nr:oligoendopeptidase F [Burkholderiales bacterium]